MMLFTSAHETKHTEQFNLMRKTKGIGLDKMCELLTEKRNLNLVKFIAQREWKEFEHEEGSIKPDSIEGVRAIKLYKALLKYSLDIDPYEKEKLVEYRENLLEKDANEYAKNFIEKHYGGWN